MNHRERVLAAVAHHQPDRVPRDYWAVPEVTQRLCTELGLPHQESLLSHLGVDLRYVEGPAYIGQEHRRLEDGSVEDHWGVRRQVMEVEGDGYTWSYRHVQHSPLARAETVADIEDYEGWPSAEMWDYGDIARQCSRHQGYAVVNKGNRLDRTAQLKPMMYLRGMTQIYVDLKRNPALVEAMLHRITDYYLDYNERVFSRIAGRADIFMMGDDFGAQQGPMMSLDMWRKYFRPGFRRYIQQAHQHGLKVMHHTCGSVKYLMAEFIDAGLDILQALQPGARDMDLARLKQEYGADITFAGSIDIQKTLPFGSPEDVQREVRQRMEVASEGGGLIIGTAHNILPDTPTENILALFEAYEEFG